MSLKTGGPATAVALVLARWASQPGAVLYPALGPGAAASRPLRPADTVRGCLAGPVRFVRGSRASRRVYAAQCEEGRYEYDYLQFPAPWVVAPTQRRTLGPPLATVRRRLRAFYNDVHQKHRTLTIFLLNDFQLLSFQAERFDAFITDNGKGLYWTDSYLFDLATGRELTLASQLQPGCARPLRHLIRRHLLHDAQSDFVNRAHRATWNWRDAAGQPTTLVLLPDDDPDGYGGNAALLALTGSDLRVIYSTGRLSTQLARSTTT